MKSEEHQRYMKVLNEVYVEKYMDATIIKFIKESPLKISILEKWERKSYHGQTDAPHQLRFHHQKHFFNFSFEDPPSEILYVRIDNGIMFGDTYQLILQHARERGEIVICGDPTNLAQGPWSAWTEFFLDHFCTRKDWTQCKYAFIMHL